jgi:hypothetical protein
MITIYKYVTIYSFLRYLWRNLRTQVVCGCMLLNKLYLSVQGRLFRMRLCHGDKWLIYIFSFCFVPTLTTSIMPPFMIYAHTQKFANWQIFISCGHPNLTVCCWGNWPRIALTAVLLISFCMEPSEIHNTVCAFVYRVRDCKHPVPAIYIHCTG